MDHSIINDASSSYGLFQGGGGGFLSLYGGESTGNVVEQTLVNDTSINAGGIISFSATGSMLAEAADVQAVGDLTIDVDEALMVTGVANTITTGSEDDRWGLGVSFASGGSGVSLFAGFQATDEKFDEQQVIYSGSSFVSGGDMTVSAGDDVTLAGSNFMAGAITETVIEDGEELTVLVASETGGDLLVTSGTGSVNSYALENFTTTDETFSQTQVGVTLSASSGTLGGLQMLDDAVNTIGAGQGNLAGINDLSATLMAVSGLTDIAGSINNLADGFESSSSSKNLNDAMGLSASVGIGMNTTSSETSSSNTQLVTSSFQSFDGDVSITSADDINLIATDVLSNENITLIAEDEVNILSGQQTYTNSSSSDSFGFGVTLDAMNGFVPSVYANGSASDTDGDGTNQVNSHVVAGGELTIQSGGDTNIIGAVATGDTLNVDVGGDLSVASVQDTAFSEGSGSNFNVSIGASGESLGFGGSDSGAEYVWVTEQSGLIAAGEADINVVGHTQLDGALLGSETEDALTFETGTFAYSNIEDNDEVHANSMNFSTNGSILGTKLSGDLYNHDIEQTNFATVSGGSVTVTDEIAQAALSETDPDGTNLNALNTNLETAQVITKNEVNSATVYLDGAAIDEIANGFPTLGKAIDSLEEILQGESLRKAQTVVGRLLEMDPDSFSACGATDTAWLNMDWLFASPAYAADVDGCLIRFANGDIIELTEEEAAAIRATVQANAEAEMRAALQAREDLLAGRDPSELSPAELQQLATIDNTIYQNASYFELCSNGQTSLADSGILDGYKHQDTVTAAAEGFKAGGDDLASQFPANGEELLALRSSNPDLYFAMYHALYSDGRNPGNFDTNVIDVMFALNGASMTNDPAARNALLMTAGTMAGILAVEDMSTLAGKRDEIEYLMALAGEDLTPTDRLQVLASAYTEIDPYNQHTAQTINRARLLIGAILGVVVAVDAAPAMIACVVNLGCLTEMGIAMAEMAAGDALGGATLVARGAAPVVTMVGGKLVLTNGDDIVRYWDDIAEEFVTLLPAPKGGVDLGDLFYQGTVGERAQLRANLIEEFPELANIEAWQAHHLIPWELRSQYAFLDDFNFNSTSNAIPLPCSGGGGQACHNGSHPNYNQAWDDFLSSLNNSGMSNDQLHLMVGNGIDNANAALESGSSFSLSSDDWLDIILGN